VSDTDAISKSNNKHHYTTTDALRVRFAILNGSTDVESSVGSDNLFATLLPTLVANGTVPQQALDQAASRTLLLRFRAGLFDPAEGQPYAAIGMEDAGSTGSTGSATATSATATSTAATSATATSATATSTAAASTAAASTAAASTAASLALAGSAARQSQTILKNEDGALPLLKGQKILVVGPLSGGKSGSAGSSAGSSAGRAEPGVYNVQGISTDAPSYNDDGASRLGGQAHTTPNVLDAIRAVNGPTGAVKLVAGLSSVTDTSTKGFAAAVAAVDDADVVVLCLGSDMKVEAEAHDRSTSAMPGAQSALGLAVIQAAKKQGKQVVLVMLGMGSLSIDELKPAADAILFAFWPQAPAVDGALAVAQTMFGDNDECCGKLPYTVYPTDYMREMPMLQMSMTAAPGRSYKYYQGEPLWPCFFGLSLANFTLSMQPGSIYSGALEQAAASDVLDDAAVNSSFTVRVSNTGTMSGAEVVFFFFRPLFTRAAPPLPFRQLVDFKRTHPLSHGESVDVVFDFTESLLSTVDGDGVRSVLPGAYELQFTNGHDQILTKNITI
jgi:hypothetical protein